METNEDNVCSNRADSEDEDCEIYFLQPASSPYNIKEKLEEANKALFEDTFDEENRQLRIKFRDDLVDYEPELTDDDVQSFESYNEVDFSAAERELAMESLPSDPPAKLELNIFTPVSIEEEGYEEEDEENVSSIEDEGEEVVEISDDINYDNGEIEFKLLEDVSKEDISISDELSSNELLLYDKEASIESEESKEKIKKSHPSKSPSKRKKIHIDCKSHCMERIPDLNLTISRLHINEKPVCPALKLLKRKCCQQNRTKNDQKLPTYSGLRSEYGLSLAQLERRQKYREYSMMREEKRRQLLKEYNQRKIQQNEQIFCQWLKTIEKRKHLEEQLRQKSKYYPKVVNMSKMVNEERPKTANYCVKTVQKPRRPETACVYVHVSPNILKNGLKVGNLVFKELNVKDSNVLRIVSAS